MSEELKCPICGEKTRIYMGNARKDRLCGQHADMLKNEEIKLNNKNIYVFVKNNKPVKQEEKQETNQKNIITINENNKSRCITCGKNTDGLLFCSQCYHKYKNKELLFKITNCSNVELLDEDYEGKYTCADGHVVKSKSEMLIDNYLFNHNIQHAYEKSLPYGRERNEIIHPDFTLPNYLGQGKDVYIEHWGFNENNMHYTQSKKFKIEKYKELSKTLICTKEEDINEIDANLDRKLNKLFIQEGKINE